MQLFLISESDTLSQTGRPHKNIGVPWVVNHRVKVPGIGEILTTVQKSQRIKSVYF
jgi:hypothetical protein